MVGAAQILPQLQPAQTHLMVWCLVTATAELEWCMLVDGSKSGWECCDSLFHFVDHDSPGWAALLPVEAYTV